jgi:hypothetical protein
MKTLLLACLWLVPMSAWAIPIHVYETHYTTSVWASSAGNDLTRVTTSVNPISDTLTFTQEPQLFCFDHSAACASAAAVADLFAVEAHTAAYPYVDPEPRFYGRSLAMAESEITFSPFLDGSATFDFSIALLPGGNQVGLYYSDGFARLEDLTSGELLWDYAWNFGLDNGHPTTWPFDGEPVHALSVEQALDSSHAYLLSMHISSGANTDREQDALYLYGLEASRTGMVATPEPDWLAMFGAAMLICTGLGAKTRSTFRASPAPIAPSPRKMIPNAS